MTGFRPPMQKGFLAAALALGAIITYVDSRPNWDDTGVTSAALLASGAALGFLAPKRPWLWALAFGTTAARRRDLPDDR